MIHGRTIIRILGVLLFIEAALMLLCAGVAYLYHDSSLHAFLCSTAIVTCIGVMLFFCGGKPSLNLSRKDSFILVSFIWIIFSLLGALPFYIDRHIPSLTDAVFESTSGFTGTGNTILNNIDAMPKGLLFWRCLTQWISGLGIIMFIIAILPNFGMNSLQIFSAESSMMLYSKIKPRIATTAKWLWGVYFGLTIVLMGLLMLGGMDIFDAICYSFTTTATGGFATHQAGVGYFHSAYIEYVIIIFMFISGINFNLLILFGSRKFQRIKDNSEFRWYIRSVIILSAAVTIALYTGSDLDIEEAFRKACFHVTSLHTSTGHVTDDYFQWPLAARHILLLTLFCGACVGSTTGGIKCARLVVLWKVFKKECKQMVHPNAVYPISINKKIVAPNAISHVLAFVTIYYVLIIFTVIILCICKVPFMESVGCALNAIGNMGNGFGQYGPSSTLAALPDMAKGWLCFAMLLGRLEIFPLALILSPSFWRRD